MISLILAFLFVSYLGLIYYQRYQALNRVPCIDVTRSQLDERQVVVDFRDYNNLSKTMHHQDSIVIPLPYLKRYYHEIPSKQVHVIASTRLEKNLGIRFLQKNGFDVIGYSLSECSCRSKTNMAL